MNGDKFFISMLFNVVSVCVNITSVVQVVNEIIYNGEL